MKTLRLIALTFAFVHFCSADDFTLIDGTKYENVRVKRVEPDGIVVMTDAGIEKLPFAKLPPEVQTARGFNAADADTYKKQQQAIQAATYAKSEEERKIFELQKKQRSDEETKQKQQAQKAALLKASSESARIKVVQVLAGGVLADKLQTASVASSSASLGMGGGGYSYYKESGDIYFYQGISGVAEGDNIEVVASRDGTYSYTDTRGASRTIEKWIVLSSQKPK